MAAAAAQRDRAALGQVENGVIGLPVLFWISVTTVGRAGNVPPPVPMNVTVAAP